MQKLQFKWKTFEPNSGLRRPEAELGGMRTYEVSQNRSKVLRDTPPRQVAKVNPKDWSLHRLWLWGRGRGKVSRKDSQYNPNLAPAVVTAVLSRVLAVQRSPANLCRDYFVFSRV